jgi:hypothetical protein
MKRARGQSVYLVGNDNKAEHPRFQFAEQELGFDRLSSAAFQSLGSEPVPWYFSYRVRIGIK